MSFKSLRSVLLIILAIIGLRFFMEWAEPYLGIRLKAGSISEKDSLLMNHFNSHCFGIDISHYQGIID